MYLTAIVIGCIVGFFVWIKKFLLEKESSGLKYKDYDDFLRMKYPEIYSSKKVDIRSPNVVKDNICQLVGQLLSEIQLVKEPETQCSYLLPMKFINKMDELLAELICAQENEDEMITSLMSINTKGKRE